MSAGGALILLEEKHGRKLDVAIAAHDETTLDQIEKHIKDSLPNPERDGEVDVRFWHLQRAHSFTDETTRSLSVPAWDDIARNYPRAARTALAKTMSDHVAGRGGNLLLWHGPPGTGKTFAIRALAWEWRKWCRLEYVADPDQFFGDADYMLNVLLDEDEADDRSDIWRLLVLEDAGELLMPSAKYELGQGLSRLLNIADGLIGQGLQVLILITTNEDLKQFHPAVARPGRCASKVEFPLFTAAEANAWLETSDPDTTVTEQVSLAELYAISEGKVMPPEPNRIGFR
jgi:SpoVK/Ycf46/Vps4 family AAA+-type ATPase